MSSFQVFAYSLKVSSLSFSHRLLFEDQDSGLFSVTLFQKAIDDFRLKARENKWVFLLIYKLVFVWKLNELMIQLICWFEADTEFHDFIFQPAFMLKAFPPGRGGKIVMLIRNYMTDKLYFTLSLYQVHCAWLPVQRSWAEGWQRGDDTALHRQEETVCMTAYHSLQH